MEKAKRNRGRQPRFTKEQQIEMLELYNSGKKMREIAKQYECSLSTVHDNIERVTKGKR